MNTNRLNSKIATLLTAAFFGAFALYTPVYAQAPAQPSPEAIAKADAQQQKRATDWVTSLQLNDQAKEARLVKVISTHLITIRDWYNDHPFTTVPGGIDPETGKRLSNMDRQIIAISAMPDSIHKNLMDGLRKDLDSAQVAAILDKYTVGKVAFTMGGYKAIVPDLTPQEQAVIEANLEQAREQAVDYKNVKQISAIFEIYKTKNEQYLNANGRNWRALYKAYSDAQKAKKGEKGEKADKAEKGEKAAAKTNR